MTGDQEWRRTRIWVLPAFVIGPMLAIVPFLVGTPASGKPPLLAMAVAAVLFGVLDLRTSVRIGAGRVAYRNALHSWELPFDDVERTEVSDNYLILRKGRRRRSFPVLSFKHASSMAGRLLDELPPDSLSDEAAGFLEQVHLHGRLRRRR